MEKMRCLRSALLPMLLGLAFAAPWALAQSAGNPEAEMKTAMAHAGFAAKADSLDGVTLHLRHVLNCMVGPQDKLFNAGAGNPCQGQGNGALPDLRAKTGQDLQFYQASWVAQPRHRLKQPPGGEGRRADRRPDPSGRDQGEIGP